MIREHSLHDLLISNRDNCTYFDFTPGTYVTHRFVKASFGVITACDHTMMRAQVVWSKYTEVPDINVQIHVQDIKAVSRKLKATWSVEIEEDIVAHSFFAEAEIEESIK